MPNHCNNRARITGPRLSLLSFVDRSQVGKAGFQFQNIVPMPAELEGTNGMSDATTPEAKALIAKFGHADWYSWHVAVWGTKWDCYDHGNSHWDVIEKGDDAQAEIEYVTAWSPASNFWKEASRSYPHLTFTHEYSEPGMSFVGTETFVAGEIVNDEQHDWDSSEGKSLRETFGDVWDVHEETENA